MIEIDLVGNSVEIELFDVFTDNHYLSTFQSTQDNREVRHESGD